jgi:hypothetical protein
LPLSTGAKIHVLERRKFEDDIRRHFVGEIEAVANNVARARGFTFVYHRGKTAYVRSRKEQIRLLALTDALLIIRLLPADARLEQIEYRSEGDRTIVTDGTFQLEIADFGSNR